MAIVEPYQIEYNGVIVRVSVTSDLGGSPIYYHWYNEGAYVGMTQVPRRDFYPEEGDELRITAIDTLNATFDPIANAPTGFPAWRSIVWTRSTDLDVARYILEQKRDVDAWAQIATIDADGVRWSYDQLSPRLDDLTDYQWRITPVDAANNNGTALSPEPVHIVRRPDAPKFTATHNFPTTTITVASA